MSGAMQWSWSLGRLFGIETRVHASFLLVFLWALFGSYAMPDGTPAKPAFQLLEERVRDCTPEWAEGITGIPAATIRALAHEMGVTARDQSIAGMASSLARASTRRSTSSFWADSGCRRGPMGPPPARPRPEMTPIFPAAASSR